MRYETRKEFYMSEVHNMAEQIAELLDNGYSIEIGRSRSGLKLFTVNRRHEVVGRMGNLDE